MAVDTITMVASRTGTTLPGTIRGAGTCSPRKAGIRQTPIWETNEKVLRWGMFTMLLQYCIWPICWFKILALVFYRLMSNFLTSIFKIVYNLQMFVGKRILTNWTVLFVAHLSPCSFTYASLPTILRLRIITETATFLKSSSTCHCASVPWWPWSPVAIN